MCHSMLPPRHCASLCVDLQLRLWDFHQEDLTSSWSSCIGPRVRWHVSIDRSTRSPLCRQSNIFTIAISASNRYIYSWAVFCMLDASTVHISAGAGRIMLFLNLTLPTATLRFVHQSLIPRPIAIQSTKYAHIISLGYFADGMRQGLSAGNRLSPLLGRGCSHRKVIYFCALSILSFFNSCR